jgi:hypothetical protein
MIGNDGITLCHEIPTAVTATSHNNDPLTGDRGFESILPPSSGESANSRILRRDWLGERWWVRACAIDDLAPFGGRLNDLGAEIEDRT